MPTLPRTYPEHPSGRDRFSPLPDKYGKMSRAGLGSTVAYYELQGFNVLYEHFMAAAAMLDTLAPEIMNVVGDIGVQEARNMVPYDTGATHDSITIVGGSSTPASGFGESAYSVAVGPETFYAPFLEYGTIYMTPRPFMLPALDIMELALVGAITAIIRVAAEGQSAGMGGSDGYGGMVLSDPRVRNPFSGFRSFLYSSSKILGDISVIGGRELFGPLRAAIYGLARGLGDVGSVMNQTLATRISNRLHGRVTGRIIGYGSATLSFGKTYSAFPGGSSGHRVYQRFVGANSKMTGISAYGSSALVGKIFG